MNENITKPSSDISDNDEFEWNDTYEPNQKKTLGSNTKDDDDSSSSSPALYLSGCRRDWFHKKSRKSDISSPNKKTAQRKRVIINVSVSLSNGENNDISFHQEPDNVSKSRKNIPPTRIKEQYAVNQRTSIHKK